MIVFDTDAWNAADRIERWRETFGRSVIRAEVLAQGRRPQDFAVRMSHLGGASLNALTMRLRAVRKTRDRSWFGDGADDLTYMQCVSGNVRFDTNGVRRFLCRGEAALFSHVVPIDLAWDEARIMTVQIPRAALLGMPNPDRLAGHVLSRHHPVRALLQVYLAELWRQSDDLSPRAERHLLDLMVEGLTGCGLPDVSPRARALPRLAAMRAMIREHAIAGLSIDQVSATIGVSPRTIERDFAGAGTSFGDELVAARLDSALAQLGRTTKISDIAFAAGFSDLSTFNRRFKQRFGRTPSEELANRLHKG